MRDADFPDTDEHGRYWGRPMVPFSLLYHCPVLSVPSGWTGQGLPVGLQIVGRRFDDAGVLRLAAALESARPRADRRPRAVKWFLGQARMNRCSKYFRPSALVAARMVLRYMFTHTPLVRNR